MKSVENAEGSMVINFKRLRGANLRKSRSFCSWVDAALSGVITFVFFSNGKALSPSENWMHGLHI
mgnify:CR=1 FL=1